MPFEFTCPYCYKKTMVDEALAGEKGACVSCGKVIQVPEPPRMSTQKRAKETGRKSLVPLWLIKTVCLTVVGAILAGAAIFVLWPSLRSVKDRRDRLACMSNLQQIAKAINAYAAEHGTYPSPVVYGPKGAQLYSWRVLILPYLGEEALYSRFKLNEPWDSQANAALLPLCPNVYISPGSDGGPGMVSESNYVLVTGKGTIFPPTGPLGPGDVADLPNRTLLVVETSNYARGWTEPSDIDVNKMAGQIGGQTIGTMSGDPTAIGGSHKGGATVVFADEQPGWLPEDIAPAAVQAMVTPAGGEPVNTEAFRSK